MRKISRAVFFWALIGTLLVISYRHFSRTSSIYSFNFTDDVTSLISSPSPSTSNLETTVQSSLEGTQGTYAVAIKNLKTGESYYYNEHQSFDTGSLYKLWIMAVTYQQIQSGILTEDQTISQDVATLNDEFGIDPDNAELTDGTITLSIHDAVNQMITISHNYAALLLTEKVKLSTVAKFLKDYGFNESTVGVNGDAPTSTASDIALFYEKLYNNQLANLEYTQTMLGFLKNQQLNGGLPKYLPSAVPIANKTGDIDQFKHDAGIVFTDKGDYIIVVMSESDSPSGAQERIAGLSKAVYDYFQNSNQNPGK